MDVEFIGDTQQCVFFVVVVVLAVVAVVSVDILNLPNVHCLIRHCEIAN